MPCAFVTTFLPTPLYLNWTGMVRYVQWRTLLGQEIVLDGIVFGYGLQHPRMVEELQSIARGDFLVYRVSSADLVSSYWQTFAAKYPLVAESLRNNFRHILITSSAAEQIFTVSNTQTDPAATHVTVRNNMHWATDFRQDLTQELLFAQRTAQTARNSTIQEDENDEEFEVIGRIRTRTGKENERYAT